MQLHVFAKSRIGFDAASYAPASPPQNPGFFATQGHGRARQPAGKAGGGGLYIEALLGLVLLLAACSGGGGNPTEPLQPPAPTTGGLEVATTTQGTDLDPDGYEVAIDGIAVGPIGLNEIRVFDQVAVGDRQVQLRGISSNCVVSENPRSVGVVGSGLARTTFQVGCTKIPTLSFAAVAGRWSGIVTETQPCCVFVFRVTYTLEAEAPSGARIGTFTISESDQIGGEGHLVARSVSGTRYVVDERVTSGTGLLDADGIRLTHDPAAETLAYKWNNPRRPGFGSEGILERVE